MHEHFIKSIHLNKERRYETKLPFKENHPVLYDHFNLCAKRLEQLFKKLKDDKELLKKYNKRNDKCFNNRAHSLFFLMAIFLKQLWLIPNILKWQDQGRIQSSSSYANDEVIFPSSEIKKNMLKECLRWA